MIIYIDLEHERYQSDPIKGQESLALQLKNKYRVEAIANEPCLVVRYEKVTPALIHELKASAVLVSGCVTDFEHYEEADLAGLRAIYKEASWPIFGFCGGHQLMAQAYGAEIAPIGTDGSAPIWEKGFMPVQQVAPHPLFANLPEQLVVFQEHYWEAKSVPTGFERLAKSEICGIQAMAHAHLPLFGVQFHPEEYDHQHDNGRQLLINFFQHIKNTV
ncbi:MAG: hypothetical protein GY805_37055 [Chloroflexi bacterium]|nr:hypothetical protein [Chloroflexota bacterium]